MRDATEMLRIISEQTFETDEELCACFITGRCISPCKTDQINVHHRRKVIWTGAKKTYQQIVHGSGCYSMTGQEMTRSVKIGRGVKKRMLFCHEF
jgi:hypothetical protein